LFQDNHQKLFVLRFTTVEALAFRGYNNLQTLQLRNNTISSMDRNAFINLQKLQTLDLANNQLTNVPSEVLQNLSNLLTLNLASNNIMIIPGDAFLGLENLKFLDLSGNRIGDIEPTGLFGLAKLQVIGNFIIISAMIDLVNPLHRGIPNNNSLFKVAEYTWLLFDYLYKKCINHKAQHV
jgi:Leucine-rich repeat (LRR) protein